MDLNASSHQQQKQHQVDHVFRHHYGQLVANLSKRVGLAHLSLVEDAVQEAMAAALVSWPIKGKPQEEGAWLYQVAYRNLMSEFRRQTSQANLLNREAKLLDETQDVLLEKDLHVPLTNEMQDDMLALLFVSSEQSIPAVSQLIFTLKSLCGFSIKEIAQRLFITPANVCKRFQRAKAQLKTAELDIAQLSETQLSQRLPNVFNVLYLIFTEGYLSSHPDDAIRIDLCEEAIYLTRVLSQHAIGNKPETLALLALMYFHLARMNSRQEGSGELVLFSDQDRSLWHDKHIETGMSYLLASAKGEHLSRYHLEASIAAEHCLAPSFEQTNWQNILSAYDKLQQISPSALLGLNRAIVVSHLKGPEAALVFLASLTPPNWLACSYHWYAVKADLLFQIGKPQAANQEMQKAIDAAPTEHIKTLLKKRFDRYLA